MAEKPTKSEEMTEAGAVKEKQEEEAKGAEAKPEASKAKGAEPKAGSSTKKKTKGPDEPTDSDEEFACYKGERCYAEYVSIYTRIPPEDESYKLPKVVDPKVQELLDKGLEYLEADKNEEAIKVLTEAIELDNKYALLTLNRAVAYGRLHNHVDCLEDCETSVELRPDWPMAYLVKGTVLYEMNRLRHSHCAFKKGLELEPDNKKLGKGEYEALLKMQVRDNRNWIQPNMTAFSDKTVQPYLRRHPKTKHLMDEPDVVRQIEEIRKDPTLMSKYLHNNDYKVSMCMGIAKSCDVNDGEIDYMDFYQPEKHEKRVKQWGSIPWVIEYNPVKEIYIPPPPPPKKEEKKHFSRFELDLDSDLMSLRRHRFASYDIMPDIFDCDRRRFK